jgi:hypothetical protein
LPLRAGRLSRVGAVLVLAAVLLVASRLEAFETDQYLALESSLADSAVPINHYLNAQIEVVLERINAQKRPLRCEEIPPRVYRRLFQNLLSSRLKRFLNRSPEIDRFPSDDVGYWRYLKESVYRKPMFPFILPLAATLQVGEVRVGIDKFGHMFGLGRRYYLRYQRGRRRGLGEEEALSRVIEWGLRLEKVLVGGLSDGVFSFGDLEANFQGMRLAREMCEGNRPYLERRGGSWALARQVDVRNYVNPGMDESFNTNYYPRGRWKKVRPILASEYCRKLQSPIVRARVERYREIDEPNVSRRVVADYFSQRGRDPQREHSVASICGPPPEEIAPTAYSLAALH